MSDDGGSGSDFVFEKLEHHDVVQRKYGFKKLQQLWQRRSFIEEESRGRSASGLHHRDSRTGNPDDWRIAKVSILGLKYYTSGLRADVDLARLNPIEPDEKDKDKPEEVTKMEARMEFEQSGGTLTFVWARARGDDVYETIEGATDDVYHPTVDDVGCRIRVSVTAAYPSQTPGPSRKATTPPIEPDADVMKRLTALHEAGEAVFEVRDPAGAQCVMAVNRQGLTVKDLNGKLCNSFAYTPEVKYTPVVGNTWGLAIAEGKKKFEVRHSNPRLRDLCVLLLRAFQEDAMKNGYPAPAAAVPTPAPVSAPAPAPTPAPAPAPAARPELESAVEPPKENGLPNGYAEEEAAPKKTFASMVAKTKQEPVRQPMRKPMHTHSTENGPSLRDLLGPEPMMGGMGGMPYLPPVERDRGDDGEDEYYDFSRYEDDFEFNRPPRHQQSISTGHLRGPAPPPMDEDDYDEGSDGDDDDDDVPRYKAPSWIAHKALSAPSVRRDPVVSAPPTFTEFLSHYNTGYLGTLTLTVGQGHGLHQIPANSELSCKVLIKSSMLGRGRETGAKFGDATFRGDGEYEWKQTRQVHIFESSTELLLILRRKKRFGKGEVGRVVIPMKQIRVAESSDAWLPLRERFPHPDRELPYLGEINLKVEPKLANDVYEKAARPADDDLDYAVE
eukprot:Rmarinus@m.22928